jgi:hypothetical protein
MPPLISDIVPLTHQQHTVRPVWWRADVETWVASNVGGANNTDFVGVIGGCTTDGCGCLPVLVCPHSHRLMGPLS